MEGGKTEEVPLEDTESIKKENHYSICRLSVVEGGKTEDVNSVERSKRHSQLSPSQLNALMPLRLTTTKQSTGSVSESQARFRIFIFVR